MKLGVQTSQNMSTQFYMEDSLFPWKTKKKFGYARQDVEKDGVQVLEFPFRVQKRRLVLVRPSVCGARPKQGVAYLQVRWMHQADQVCILSGARPCFPLRGQ